MTKPAVIIWILAFTVAAGALITVVLNVPSLQNALGMWILVAVGVAAVGAIPISMSAAKALTG
jgi:hypothetical protein